jgi:Protein of unknown function (DUF4058)
MPIHDWTRVPAGTYHFFHQRWISAIADALNDGGLPEGFFAMSEVDAKGPIPDVLARRSDHLSVYLPQGELLAVIEIISPGNKDNTNGLKAFVRKAGKLLRRGVHLLVVDLFPPSVRDPHGIHKAIWDPFKEEPFELPPAKPLTLAAYSAGPEKVANVENIGVGDPLPDMPIFLTPDHYVPCPLEASYQVTWGVFPRALKGPLEPSTT